VPVRGGDGTNGKSRAPDVAPEGALMTADIPGAQAGFTIRCVYTGPDMKSHVRALGFSFLPGNASALSHWTALFPVAHWRAARLEPGLRGWHANPNPAVSILVRGRVETTVGGGGGVTWTSVPGDIGLSLDALGEGHRTNVIGPEPACVLALMLTRAHVAELARSLTGWPVDMVLPPLD
jgi:hypothetical protein